MNRSWSALMKPILTALSGQDARHWLPRRQGLTRKIWLAMAALLAVLTADGLYGRPPAAHVTPTASTPAPPLSSAARTRGEPTLAARLATGVQPPTGSAERASRAQLQDLHAYIRRNWDRLMRTSAGLAQAAIDPKVQMPPDDRWPVYISRHESLEGAIHRLRAEGMPARDFERLEIRQLPDLGAPLTEHGLLYLPHPYVVPGGRFNEMYGWDSYFIQVGLLRDNRIELAKPENSLYQIEHYGHILNANRTYYLTRSQPPFLTPMVLGVYRPDGGSRLAPEGGSTAGTLLSLLDHRGPPDQDRTLAVLRPRPWPRAGGRLERARRGGSHVLRPRESLLPHA
jgi:hypothetical protein